MSDFIKKYIVFYVFWLMFLSFICGSLQMTTGTFSSTLPVGSEFSINYLKNTFALLVNIITFQVEGVGGIIATFAFYLPSLPIIIWILEMTVAVIDAIIPF